MKVLEISSSQIAGKCMCETSTCVFSDYRIYSHVNRPVYKPTPIPVAENLAKMSDSCITKIGDEQVQVP